MFSSQTYLALKNLKGVGSKKILEFRYSLFANKDLKDPSTKNEFVDLVQTQFGGIERTEALKSWVTAEETIEETQKLDIKIVGYDEPEFPNKFRDQEVNSPVVIFIKGEVASLNQKRPYVAVVGSREATHRGLSVARKMGCFLAEKGIIVVSGLALGCDTQGHLGALEKSGTTIAVLAHGLDEIRPPDNKKLAEKIVSSGGALITEYEINQEVLNYQYAERNRLQTGLSDLVFVVDTGLKGGTQHTIKYAIKQRKKLACRLPRKKEKDYEQVQGNFQLIDSGYTGVSNTKDLEKLISTL